jgi:3-phosphoshikimate 1-carboxyvinyltransferase
MRALVFGMLGAGKTVVHRPLDSPDVDAMIDGIRLLGADVNTEGGSIEVVGNLRPAENVIDAGNSGLVLRLLGAVGALTSGYTVITGDHSIRHLRPVQPLLDGLTQLGAFAVSAKEDGTAPIILKGPLKGGTALVDGADSQPISGLLIASAFTPAKTELFVANPGEKPWVSLTLNWFDRLGISYQNDGFEKFIIPGHAAISGFEYTVPGDLSSAAYPIAAALITDSELTLTNVDIDDLQGDKHLIFQLQKMGAKIEIDKERKMITVSKGSHLKGAKIDVNNFIDSLTILSVIGCFAEGITEIVGGKIARNKESDRIHTVVAELKKMGAKIHEKEDGVVIEHSPLHGAALESHADHRMAMSLAVAGLGAKGESVIQDVGCVSKSYPPFFEHLKQLGAKIE